MFAILINDGKQDAMLQATDFLRNRLTLIRAQRAAQNGTQDATPTLRDVEETHILFVNAHFRPFVTFAFEYHQTTATGTPTFAGVGATNTIQFSVEQFGEFFHDMVVQVQISATDTAGTALVQWADDLGQLLFNQVNFRVNGTLLDNYSSETMNFYNKFFVTPNKRVGYNRLVGQANATQLKVFASDITAATNTVNGAQWATVDSVINGLQNAKPSHPAFNLWVPLLFWFNCDSRISFPSISVPYGQRFIEIVIPSLSTLLFPMANANLGITTSVLSTSGWNSVPAITAMNLFTNNIFVHKDIHEIYLKRVGFNMIRVHREQLININQPTGSFQMQNMKWPIETLYFGIRPQSNFSHPVLWDKYYAVQTAGATTPFQSGTYNVLALNSAGVLPTTASTAVQMYNQIDTFDTVTLTLQNIYIYNAMPKIFFNAYTPFTYGAQHINTPDDSGVAMVVFNLYPGAYQPSGYLNISRAREFYINYSSSVIGVTNYSQILTGNAQTWSGLVQGTLSILGIAINFLLVSDGSAVLRYTT